MYFVALRIDGELTDPTYEGLHEALQRIGPWSNRLGHTWLIESGFSSRRIRDLLKPHLQPGDRLFVGQFTGNWAGTGMGAGFPDWLKRRSFERP